MHPSAASNVSDQKFSNLTSEQLTDWISKAANGSREYQQRIYELIAARTYRIIRKIVGESHADDVMQDLVIHLFSKLDQFRFESSLETWVHRLAINQGLQFLRKMNREEEKLQQVAMATECCNNSDELRETQNSEVLQLAMDKIAADQRALLHMKEIEGLDYETIASVLGIPLGTVGSRLNKARKELRNALIQLGWEE
jgi:RNA polymerase sigma-70 factor, ECF subfamily